MENPFRLLHTDPSGARRGTLELQNGAVPTPAFMPVGTSAAVKAVTPAQVEQTEAAIVLANTYHLALQPGAERIAKLGGLHAFMGWKRPILTDSGGFQVFSLPKKEIDEKGVTFEFEKGGKAMELTPESSMKIQEALGADVIMAFDECLPFPCPHPRADKSIDRTHRWAMRCLEAHTRENQCLFGIVQGSTYQDLRERSAAQITSLPFDGFAIGGVSVGEGLDLLKQVVGWTVPLLPPDRARYLMGVGLPEDVVESVALGMDMFDCVIPTRYARGGTLFTSRGRIRIDHRRYRRDGYPLDSSCDCYSCQSFSRAYVHHLFEAKEILGQTLATIHNLRFYQTLTAQLREAIEQDRFLDCREQLLTNWSAHQPSKR